VHLIMTEVDKDFDLLAGHDLGESRNIIHHDDDDPEKMDVLVWHKLETMGYQPSAREVRMTKHPLSLALLTVLNCFGFVRATLL
jgi:hypothetical protein